MDDQLNTYELCQIPFDFKVGDILVVRPGDLQYEINPVTFRVLARVAEDFGTGFVINYQVRSCAGARNYGDSNHDLKSFRESEMMLYTAYETARILLQQPAKDGRPQFPGAQASMGSAAPRGKLNKVR